MGGYMNKDKIIQLYIKPLIVIFLCGVMYYFNYLQAIIILLIMYIVECILKIRTHMNKEIKKENFTNYISKHIKSYIYNLIIPVVLTKKNGEIIWCNERFSSIRKEESLIGRNIISAIRGINIDFYIKDIQHQKLKVSDNIYDIQGTQIEIENEVFKLFYFSDITKTLDEDEKKEDIMLIEVDNLNDVLESTDEDNRPLVVAEIERTINIYANNMNAMVKKYSTSKYILSVQDKYIEEQIKEKFPILDNISKIKKGNKIEVTLSIGIGREGLSPMENNNAAKSAKQLALGRGGDQVVIKENEDTKFFGGNSKETEKRTRVRARVASNALSELIDECKKVYIIGHRNPDMDCFGSSVALSGIIKQLGKDCKIILDKDTNAIQYFLDKLNETGYNDRFIGLEEAYNNSGDEDSLLIILDVHNKNYVADIELVNRFSKKVIIDHHRRGTQIIEEVLLTYIEAYASSTAEMITEVIQYLLDKPKLAVLEAEGLLAGIYMDTKGFSFKTGVRTFEASSFLRKMGADTIEVKKMFTENLDDYLLISDTIRSAKVNKINCVAIEIGRAHV